VFIRIALEKRKKDGKIVSLSIDLGRNRMSKSALDNGLGRPMRRGTRINQAVRLKVTGVDSYRGPYCEEVSTDKISCHGCKFKSKYDVLIDSEVMLEVNNEKQGGRGTSAPQAQNLIALANRPRF
jgi:hypothetical protein